MAIISPKRGNIFIKCIRLLSAVIVIAGCASPAKIICMDTDWMRVGFEEGRQGQLAQRSALQRDSCTREGAPPDMSLYEQGRRKGLESFCTPESGRALGAKGGVYQDNCPPERKGPFVAAYHKGLRAYAEQLEDRIKSHTGQQNKLRQELAGVLVY